MGTRVPEGSGIGCQTRRSAQGISRGDVGGGGGSVDAPAPSASRGGGGGRTAPAASALPGRMGGTLSGSAFSRLEGIYYIGVQKLLFTTVLSIGSIPGGSTHNAEYIIQDWTAGACAPPQSCALAGTMHDEMVWPVKTREHLKAMLLTHPYNDPRSKSQTIRHPGSM